MNLITNMIRIIDLVVYLRLFVLIGILSIQPKVAIGIGIAVVIGGGIAFAGYSIIKKKLAEIPPKKLDEFKFRSFE